MKTRRWKMALSSHATASMAPSTACKSLILALALALALIFMMTMGLTWAWASSPAGQSVSGRLRSVSGHTR